MAKAIFFDPALSIVPIEERRTILIVRISRNGDKEKKKGDFLIKKQVYIIIQPDHFSNEDEIPNTQLVESIVVLDEDGYVLLNDGFNCESYLFVKDLLTQDYELVTYNGYLLEHMLWKFWNCETANIVDLMEDFAIVYAKDHGWYKDGEEPFYVWKKLITALEYYYGEQDEDVDIYKPFEVIEKTRFLHIAMKKSKARRSHEKHKATV